MQRLLRRTAIALLLVVFFASAIRGEEEQQLYRRGELRVIFHQLNYIDAANCLDILGMVGYEIGPPQFPIPLEKLPAVFSLPDSDNISIVGSQTLINVGDGAPQQRIGIIYHETQIEEFGALIRFIDDEVDVQATQVQIEAMVVELTESGRRELGLEYDLRKDLEMDAARRGRSAVFDSDGVLGLSLMRFTEERGRFFEAKLQALIRDRKAEVLSAPSVLTLDNRHARIEIKKRVPVFTGQYLPGPQRWDINIRYEEVGIVLNIKPRVDRTGEWVTLQVQTEVSEDIDYFLLEGQQIAPEIERRIVETISRIRNNHPFIVGGLIRDDLEHITKKVPLLGDIPVLGRLFRVDRTIQEKREVIIVLTPRVIRPTASDRPIMPKDDERFDFFDTRLFRESYLLKAEDVYDLGFILDRPEIRRLLGEARRYLDMHPELADEPPFDAVAGNAIPGEEAVVNRMLYDVVRKLDLFHQIDPDRLILFTPDRDDPAGFSVSRLRSLIQQAAGDQSIDEYLDQSFPKRVLYVTFEMLDHGGANTSIDYPVATVHTEYQVSARSAERRLYELGRLDGMSRPQIAFMISSRRELERMQTSIIVREILDVNDPGVIQRIANFSVGRRIAIPEIDPAKARSFLIDRNAAKPFYHSHFYYAEFEEQFRIYIDALKTALEAEGFEE